jgi:uncharacterized protein with PIN domain
MTPFLRLCEEFRRCTGCSKIYWRGSHVDRIVKDLDALLSREAGGGGAAQPRS